MQRIGDLAMTQIFDFSNHKLAGAGLLAVLIAASGAAQASLIGDSVQIQSAHPNSASRNSTDVVIVGAAHEIDCPGSFAACNSPANPILLAGDFIDIGASTIQISFATAASFAAADFNGWIFSDLDPGFVIGSVALTSSFAGFGPSNVSFTGNSVSLNFAGLTSTGPGAVTVELISQSVPEPATAALLLLGMAGMFAGGRKSSFAGS